VCSVLKVERDIFIDCEVEVSSEYDHFYIKEEEVEGVAEGDFLAQMISPLSGELNLFHSPFPLPLPIKKLKDRVTTIINLDLAFKEGSMLWIIPTYILDEKKNIIEKVEITQKYFLSDHKLSLYKGGKLLFIVNLLDYFK